MSPALKNNHDRELSSLTGLQNSRTCFAHAFFLTYSAMGALLRMNVIKQSGDLQYFLCQMRGHTMVTLFG